MKLLFVTNTFSFFLSHRIAIGKEAMRRQYSVAVLSGHELNPEKDAIAKSSLAENGFSVLQAKFTASGVSPFAEIIGLISVIRLVSQFRLDVVHTASPKGSLYGGIAARLCRVPKLVIAVSGQGFLFTGQHNGWKAVIADIYLRLIRWVYAHPNCTVIVQNQDDWNSLLAQRLVQSSQLVLIKGSGVDLDQYAAVKEILPERIVLMPARVLIDKGVHEFVQAAKRLKEKECNWRFVIAGEADGSNPSAISSAQVRQWVDEGVIEWWGHCCDMADVFGEAAIVCLPSYREGMPKALLEAAACGRPVVTTDTVGCREAIIDGETGILVPVRDAEALARALLRLMENPDLRERMGKAGRERAIREFDIKAVVARHMAIYAS